MHKIGVVAARGTPRETIWRKCVDEDMSPMSYGCRGINVVFGGM